MVVLFLYCSVTLVNQSADISRMQKQKQTLTAQLASVQQENARLEEVVAAPTIRMTTLSKKPGRRAM